MQLVLKPTGQIETINGVPARIWEGTSDQGVPVKAWISFVSPQTHIPEQAAAFERELREVKPERRLVSFDMRMAIP